MTQTGIFFKSTRWIEFVHSLNLLIYGQEEEDARSDDRHRNDRHRNDRHRTDKKCYAVNK